MKLSKAQLQQLMSNLDPSRVSTRKQSGRSLSYVEAHDIKAMLIRIFGFGGFDAEVIDTQILKIEQDVPNSKGGTTAWRVTASSRVRLTIHDADTPSVYMETAAASQSGADIGEVTDFAIKTASSDALKRCAIYLGTQFGLSLYDNGSKSDTVKVIFEPGQAAGLRRDEPEERGNQLRTMTPEEVAVKGAMMAAKTKVELRSIWKKHSFGSAPGKDQAEVTAYAANLPEGEEEVEE